MGSIRDGELLTKWERGSGCWCCGQQSRERLFIRDIETECQLNVNTWKLWQRFAILPNVEGQKYTIGQTFSSRVEQGEFIYLSPEHLTSKVETGCAISILGNKYFVSPTSKRSLVFINAVKVTSKTELAFGDFLCLGKEKYAFLFKERVLNPEAFIFSENMRHHQEVVECPSVSKSKKTTKKTITPSCDEVTPGQNGLILSHVLSYLSVDHLKEIRFVSKLWNEEAFKLLRKRCTLDLEFNWGSGYEKTTESMKLFRYSVEMANNPLPNWSIALPSLGLEEDGDGDGVDTSEGQPGAKMLEDLDYFIVDDKLDARRSLKRLNLGGAISSRKDYDVRLKVLQAVGGGVEEFTWRGSWYLDTAPGKNYPFPEDIHFQKLKVFTLSLSPLEPGGWGHDEAKNCSSLTWLQPFIKSIHRVTTIRLECSTSLALLFCNTLTKPGMMSLLSNLREVSVHHVTVNVIKILLKLDKPLKKLELFDLKNLEKSDFQYFAELLQKHCQTLESLLFIIPPSPMDENDTPPLFISFPAFPKLINLNVGWGPEEYQKTQDIKLTFPDGTSFVNYANDLPSLKCLTLYPLGYRKYSQIETSFTVGTQPERVWENCGSLFKMFFPPIATNGAMQIVKSVQFLDALYEVPVGYQKESPLFSEEAEVLIAAMFPNVNNKWITSIRDGSSRKKYKIEEKKKIKPKPKAKKSTRDGLRSDNLIQNTRLRPRSSPGSRVLAKPSTSRSLRTRKK